MKKIFSLGVIMFMLSLCLNIPKLNAEPKIGMPDLEPDISLDFKDADLKDVLKALSIQSGLNFIASQGLQERKITLYLDKVPLRESMDKLFKASNLSYDLDRDSNVFVVKDWGTGGVETVTRVFYLKHATVSSSSVKEEMANLLRSSPGQAGIGTGTSTTGTAATTTSSTEEDKGKWKVEDDAGISRAITKLLSENGSLIEDWRTNSLIVTDTPQRMEVICQVIASLDIVIPQVMLEVEMLDVRKSLVDKIGFKYGQTPFTAIIKGGTATWGGPFGNWGDVIPTTGSIGINPTDATAYKVQLDFLRTDTSSKYLARPKILTLNNETAEIKITTQEAVGEIKSESGETGSTTTTTEAERYETGVALRITPQIDVEAGEITMFVVPAVAEAFPSGIKSSTGVEFFNPETRSTKTLVRVKDGETVVIGGLIKNKKSDIITKLPFFGDLPLVGALFRHRSSEPNEERELLVFITPHIIKNSENKQLAQVKRPMLPEREQALPVGRRESEVSSALSSFEKR